MTRYTHAQIKECHEYLGYCIENGSLDKDIAEEIIKQKDWNYVYKIMNSADKCTCEKENDL